MFFTTASASNKFEMDVHDLFLCCRRGDIPRVKYLVEQKEIDLNTRDKWDSTPLYYACLCGHSDLVEYLLENGARCEANTFDGERCLYGALTIDIRNILLRYNVISSGIIRRDSYEEFLRKLLESGENSDTVFVVHDVQFPVHRAILSARCDYFKEMFQSKWKLRRTIKLNNSLVKPHAFRTLLRYIYTARLDSLLDEVEDCIRLANQCKLFDFKHELEEAVKKVDSFADNRMCGVFVLKVSSLQPIQIESGQHFQQLTGSEYTVKSFSELQKRKEEGEYCTVRSLKPDSTACTKPGTRVTTVLVESPRLSSELQQDLGVLAEQALPPEMSDWVVGSELPLMPSVPTTFVDVCFFVKEHRFMCHKVFFSGRSEYFRALLSDHFDESLHDYSQGMLYINLHDVEPKVFACIVHYVYENSVQFTDDVVYDVLCAADVYLLPGLKRLCGNYLGPRVDDDCVIALIRTARLFQLPRLENQCTDYIAKNLETMSKNSDFSSLILEDAQAIKDRQETDTIDVVDDIRYHITGSLENMSYGVIEEANEKLKLIDDLLEELGLDA